MPQHRLTKSFKAGLKLRNWGGTNVRSQLFIRLYPNTQVKQVERQLNDILKKNNPVTLENKSKTQKFMLQPLGDIHFNQNYGGMEPVTIVRLIKLPFTAYWQLAVSCCYWAASISSI